MIGRHAALVMAQAATALILRAGTAQYSPRFAPPVDKKGKFVALARNATQIWFAILIRTLQTLGRSVLLVVVLTSHLVRCKQKVSTLIQIYRHAGYLS